MDREEAWEEVERLVVNTSARVRWGKETWAAIEKARAADETTRRQLQERNEQQYSILAWLYADRKQWEAEKAALQQEVERLRDAVKSFNKSACDCTEDAARWQVRYQQVQQENDQLREQNAALTAQFRSSGIVPYLERMKELAARAEKAEQENETLRQQLGDALAKLAGVCDDAKYAEQEVSLLTQQGEKNKQP